jgi:precorrin-4/cobalt-precorrin-4 C11-methyltransferase
MGIEYTLPEISQTLILTRMAGRTPVPQLENLASLAQHQTSMAIYLSISLVNEAAKILIDAYGADSACAVAYCVSRPEEKIIFTRLKNLAQTVKVEKITRTALIIVGKVLDIDHAKLTHRSKLYQKGFEHGYRK